MRHVQEGGVCPEGKISVSRRRSIVRCEFDADGRGPTPMAAHRIALNLCYLA